MSKHLLPSDALADKLSEEKSEKKKLYPEISNELKAQTISTAIALNAKALRDQANKIDLSDVEQVRQRTEAYIDACAEAGIVPTVMGLSTYGFGTSRQWVNEFCRNHHGSESAQYIERVKDAFADVLVSTSLGRAVDSTMAIFTLKNCNGFSDKLSVEPVQQHDPQGPLLSIEELEARINALPDD